MIIIVVSILVIFQGVYGCGCMQIRLRAGVRGICTCLGFQALASCVECF